MAGGLKFLGIYKNLKTLAQIGAEKSVTEIIVRKKEKWTKKGTDKPNVPDSLIHNTTCHYQALYQRGGGGGGVPCVPMHQFSSSFAWLIPSTVCINYKNAFIYFNTDF